MALAHTDIEPSAARAAATDRAGLSAADEPIESWLDSQALATINYFAAGINDAGDPIVSWGAPLLECELRRLAPAQSTMIFAYGA